MSYEPDYSVVYAELTPAGARLRAGDARNDPLTIGSPLWMELFEEAQADNELELGNGYRVEAGHGWARCATPRIADHWEPITDAAERAAARDAADRRRPADA